MAQPKGKVLVLDGESSYLQLPELKEELDSAVTIALWVHKENWEVSSVLTGVFGNLEYGGFSLDLAQYEVRARVMRESYKWTSYNTRRLQPGWHHLALTYDGSLLKLYVDGLLRSQKDFEDKMGIIYPEESIPLLLGAELDESSAPQRASFLKGMLDRVAVFDRALMEDEVWEELLRTEDRPKSIFTLSFDDCTSGKCTSDDQQVSILIHGSPKFQQISGSFLRTLSYEKWPKSGTLLLCFTLLILGVFQKNQVPKIRKLLLATLALCFLVAVLRLDHFFSHYLLPFWTTGDINLIAALVTAVVIFMLSLTSFPFQKWALVGALSIAVLGILGYTLPHAFLSTIWICAVLVVNASITIWLITQWKQISHSFIFAIVLLLFDVAWILWSYLNMSIQNPFAFALFPVVAAFFTVLLVVKNEPLFASGFQLSARETEVANLMTEGLSDQEIADKLFVSFNTARTHIRKIYKKLEVGNRVDAIRKLKRNTR